MNIIVNYLLLDYNNRHNSQYTTQFTIIQKDFNKLLEGLSYVLDNPFKITFCNNSLKSIFTLLFIYLFLNRVVKGEWYNG